MYFDFPNTQHSVAHVQSVLPCTHLYSQDFLSLKSGWFFQVNFTGLFYSGSHYCICVPSPLYWGEPEWAPHGQWIPSSLCVLKLTSAKLVKKKQKQAALQTVRLRRSIESYPLHAVRLSEWINFMSKVYTVVSQKYAPPPPFATLALVQSTGGLICGIQHFLSWLHPPFRFPARIIEQSMTSLFMGGTVGAECRTQGGEMLPTLAVGWQASESFSEGGGGGELMCG